MITQQHFLNNIASATYDGNVLVSSLAQLDVGRTRFFYIQGGAGFDTAFAGTVKNTKGAGITQTLPIITVAANVFVCCCILGPFDYIEFASKANAIAAVPLSGGKAQAILQNLS